MNIAWRLQRLRRVYYGWWLLAGSIAAMALGSGVSFWAFGLYIAPLESEFGWSRGEVSGGLSLGLLSSGLAGPLTGRWIDARGPRQVILFGAVTTALSYGLLATTSELWQWYVYSAINGVFRQMMFFIPFQALISRWFDRRRGVALSILGTGFALGGVVVVPTMRWVIDTLGWGPSFIFSGVVITLLFLPLGTLLVRNHPSDVGAEPDGAAPPAGRVEAGPGASRLTGLTLRAALATPHFWLVAFGFTFLFFGMFGMLVHQIPLYVSLGVPRATAALIVSGMAALGVGSRLAFGVIADRLRRFEYLVITMCACLASGLLALLLDSGVVGITLFVLLWVCGTGGGPIIESMLLTRMFGLAHFATLLGAMFVIEEAGLVLSPVVAGWIFDVTGSYDLALVMFICSLGLAALLFYVVSRLPQLRFEPAREG